VKAPGALRTSAATSEPFPASNNTGLQEEARGTDPPLLHGGPPDLLVIPPETEPAAAARLMAAATVPGGIRTASGLMADEAMGHDAAEARSREEEWETDSGAAAAAGAVIGTLSSAQRR
jgi:hypothetical protein